MCNSCNCNCGCVGLLNLFLVRRNCNSCGCNNSARNSCGCGCNGSARNSCGCGCNNSAGNSCGCNSTYDAYYAAQYGLNGCSQCGSVSYGYAQSSSGVNPSGVYGSGWYGSYGNNCGCGCNG